MNAAQRKRRVDRLATLNGKARLTTAETIERDWLLEWRDRQWHNLPRSIANLPRSIANLRVRLDALCAYADEIGLGPC